jgi:hypothetical protein
MNFVYPSDLAPHSQRTPTGEDPRPQEHLSGCNGLVAWAVLAALGWASGGSADAESKSTAIPLSEIGARPQSQSSGCQPPVQECSRNFGATGAGKALVWLEQTSAFKR